MYHGKQIIGPDIFMAWTLVTVANIIELSDFYAQFFDKVIADIPDRHAVTVQSEAIMIGNHTDPPNDTVVEHDLHTTDNYFDAAMRTLGDFGIGLRPAHNGR